jgi:hypothetical protein
MNTSLQLPIIVAEGEDISVFESVKSAESYIEAIDVDDGVYQAWDSEGRVLTLTADPPYKALITRAVHISVEQPEKLEPEKLEAYLAKVLRKYVDPKFESISLEETIAKIVSWVGITR